MFKLTTKSIFVAALVTVIPTNFAAALDQPSPSKGYFISIDGMRPDYLETLVKEGKLNARRGLGWLYRNGLFAKKTFPVSTTLTAVSHVSTITCSFPSDHGVIANSFMKDGVVVNGFGEDIGTETLWQAARSQGKKVLSLAYVGTDGRSPARQVDAGVAYPDAKIIAPAQTLKLNPTQLPIADGWILTDDLKARQPTELHETELKVTLNPLSREERTLKVLLFNVAVSQGPQPTRQIEVIVAADKDLTKGVLAHLKRGAEDNEFGHLYFTEESAASATRGFKRYVYLTISTRSETEVVLFASRPTYNLAQPTSLREHLDAKNMVWPDDGWRAAKNAIGAAQQVNVYNLHGRYLAEVAREARALGYAPDVTLFYQPVIDSFGHSFQAIIPQPFSSTNQDGISQNLVKAFQNVDENVSILLENITAKDVVALMGDHGMDPVKKVANPAALIPELNTKVSAVTSGSLLMLYKNPAFPDVDVDSVGAALAAKLEAAEFEGTKVNGRSFRKKDFLAPDKPWQFGQAEWAFTSNSGFYFTFNAIQPEFLTDPSALGMHGQDNSVATMATGFLFKAPGVRKQQITEMNLIDAVPTFAKHMGIKAPAGCRGKPITSILNTREKMRKVNHSR